MGNDYTPEDERVAREWLLSWVLDHDNVALHGNPETVASLARLLAQSRQRGREEAVAAMRDEADALDRLALDAEGQAALTLRSSASALRIMSSWLESPDAGRG